MKYQKLRSIFKHAPARQVQEQVVGPEVVACAPDVVALDVLDFFLQCLKFLLRCLQLRLQCGQTSSRGGFRDRRLWLKVCKGQKCKVKCKGSLGTVAWLSCRGKPHTNNK